jgi:two-component system OmpR family response regulator
MITNMAKTILVIDDNNDLRENTAEILDLAGYKTFTAENGKRGVEVAVKEKPDVIVCDIMMPELDGYGVLHLLRKNPDTQAIPFIFLTAKTERSDFRKGMEMGADDYVTKPFSSRELLARINAVIRRTQMLPPNLQVSEAGRQLAFGEWRLDTTARHLLDAQDTAYPLSGAEFRLLRVFLDHANRVLSRDQLLSLTQGRDAELFDRSIDLLVSRVRQRLGDDAREPTYIKTVRSEGYVFSVPVQLLGPEE